MTSTTGWSFIRFGLIVTGKGERIFLPRLFRGLMENGRCAFTVVRQIGQRRPVGTKRALKMVGQGKQIADRDEEEIGIPARQFLVENPHSFVLLIDDIEADWVERLGDAFRRYREAFDTLLAPRQLESRASVHFFVNMLEAYYFADAATVNAVLGTAISDHEGDVETIRHPKNRLKGIARQFDEVEQGAQIIARLNVDHVLSNRDHCSALRTVFAWCRKALGEPLDSRWQLDGGVLHPVTAPQLDSLPSA